MPMLPSLKSLLLLWTPHVPLTNWSLLLRPQGCFRNRPGRETETEREKQRLAVFFSLSFFLSFFSQPAFFKDVQVDEMVSWRARFFADVVVVVDVSVAAGLCAQAEPLAATRTLAEWLKLKQQQALKKYLWMLIIRILFRVASIGCCSGHLSHRWRGRCQARWLPRGLIRLGLPPGWQPVVT